MLVRVQKHCRVATCVTNFGPRAQYCDTLRSADVFRLYSPNVVFRLVTNERVQTIATHRQKILTHVRLLHANVDQYITAL